VAGSKKVILIFALLIIVSGLVLYPMLFKEEVIGVSSEQVALRDIAKTISYSGFIEAESKVLVSSEIAGRVAGVYFKELDYVKEGKVLVKLADDEIRAQLQQAEASVSEAKIRLDNAEKSLERAKTLFEKGFIPDEEMEHAQLQANLHEAALDKARSSHEVILARLNNATITAPISGIVTKKHVEQGEIVAGPLGSKGLAQPVPIAEITDFNSLEVHADVDEVDIAKVEIGQEAMIAVDAYPEETLRGKVQEIALVPSGKKEVGTNYRVKVKIANPVDFLKLGMTSNVDFSLASKKNALSLSRTSVLRDGKKTFVLVIQEGRVQKKVIHVGIEGEEYIEIVQGLAESENVITGDNLEELKEGQRVHAGS
jgi:RND family efflux transporter MFP subunit